MKFNHILEKIIKLLLFASPLVMLYVNADLLYPYISGKAYLFRALIEITLIFYILLVSRDKSYLPNFKNPLVVAVSFFMFILTITSFTGIDWQHSFFGTVERSEGLFHILHYYVYFLLLVSVFKKRKDWDVILGAYLVSVLAMTVYSWCNGFWSRDLSDINNTIYGTAGHKVYYGVALMFAIFFNLYILLFRTRRYFFKIKFIKVVFIAITIFSLISFFVSLVMSKARGPMLGLIAGIVISILLFILFGNKRYKYYKITIVICMLFVIIFSTIIFIFKDGPLLYDKGIIHRYFGLSLEDKTLSARFWTWGSAWQGIKEKPIWGWGLENFYFPFDKYFNVQHYFGPGSETWFDHPHNILIEMWVVAGIGGLVAYLMIFGVVIYELLKRHYIKNRNICFWTVGFLAAYLIQNIFSFDTIYSYMGFFILLGLIYQLSLFKSKNKHQDQTSKNNTHLLPVIFCCIGIVILNYWANYQTYLGNTRLLQEINLINSKKLPEAKKLFEKNLKINNPFILSDLKNLTVSTLAQNYNQVDDANYVEFAKTAALELEQDIYLHPNDARAMIPLAKLYRIIGEEFTSKEYFLQSEYYFQKALAINPNRPEAIFGLARTYMFEKNYEKAIKIINIFLAIRPDDNYSHFILGTIYKDIGEIELSKKEFELAGINFEE